MQVGDKVRVEFVGIINNIGVGFDDKQVLVSVRIDRNTPSVMSIPTGACTPIGKAEESHA